MKDFTGLRSGKLVAVQKHSQSRSGVYKYLCNCDCGGTHVVLPQHLLSGKITHCGCEPYRGRQHKQWKGCGDLSGNFWDSIKRGANGSKGRKPIAFDITIEFAWNLFEQQKGLCALSGMPIRFRHTTTQTNSQTASLDRIDSSKGYVEGNVQWVHKNVNIMKNSFDQEYFLSLCKNITENKREL